MRAFKGGHCSSARGARGRPRDSHVNLYSEHTLFSAQGIHIEYQQDIASCPCTAAQVLLHAHACSQEGQRLGLCVANAAIVGIMMQPHHAICVVAAFSAEPFCWF